MRIRNAGIAALVAAVGIWMSFPAEPAMAAKMAAKTATKTTAAKVASKPVAKSRVAKTTAKAKVAAADRPIVLSKFKKPRRAQTAGKTRTAHKQHARKSASRVSVKAVAQKIAVKDTESITAMESGIAANGLPPSVANARAQALADDQARNIAALDGTDVSIVDGVQIATAEQTNNADSAPPVVATQNAVGPSAPVAVPASQPAQTGKIIRAVSSSEKQVLKAASDSDPWSNTSLIGKIFIAFGSLLTVASAARLIIA